MNPAKAKGTAWESALVQAFRDEFGNCERLALAGANDEGDLWFHHEGIPYVIEAKAERAMTLSSYVREAYEEAAHWSKARPDWPTPGWAAIIKRRQHGVKAAYVVMDLTQFVSLVKRNGVSDQIRGVLR